MAHAQTLDRAPTPADAPVSATHAPGTAAGAMASERAPRPRQLAVTIVAQVERRHVARLKRLLRTMGQDPAGNAVLPLAAIPRAHFARLLVLDATEDLAGGPIEAQIVLLADVDRPAGGSGALEACLVELVEVAGDGLDRIFGGCADYPTLGPTRVGRLAFLRSHAVGAAAAYVNTIGRSVQQIREEAALRVAIERFLDDAGDWARHDPGEVRAAIKDFVDRQPELAWARVPAPSPSLGDRVTDTADLLRLPLGLLVLAPLLVPTLPLWALVLRLHELHDPAPHIRPTANHVEQLAEIEDRGPQNQFSAIGFVKPGLFRRLITGGVTRGIDYASRHVYGHANLAGVKTIHFARWVSFDGGRRLLFASNYDGSVESYNDDFIDKVWWGLNAVFSNGFGYPRTSWLVFGGATREQPFKDYLRCRQVVTQVWYSAYPELSALNIENNACIRAGLYGEMSRTETQRWLRRI